jgi:pimeloyl-ACP methyl ester carboxylesterase
VGVRADAALAILNGAIGDYLGRTGNGLATPMACVHLGKPLAVEPAALADALSEPTPRVVMLVHGLMCTEAVWRFRGARDRTEVRDYGTMLAADLGYTPVYLRYNSGLAIADNGAALASLLEALVGAYPVAVEEILVIAHSLGGLVVRSACEQAATRTCRWRSLLRRVVFVDTPHLGSPLERLGRATVGLLRAVDGPYTRLAAAIGDLRSDGIKDLGDANVAPAAQRRPLPPTTAVEHCIIAAGAPSKRNLAAAVGDILVPVSSATASPPESTCRVRVFPGIGHLELARHPEVYAQIRTWCEESR